MGTHMKRKIKWSEIDREFIAHMEEVDRKQARAYQRNIALEDSDNFSAMIIEKTDIFEYKNHRLKDDKELR
jgi:hypothetical protein